MNIYKHAQAMKKADLSPTGTIPDSHKIIADLFQELAEHGSFNETGGELSDEDWADSQ